MAILPKRRYRQTRTAHCPVSATDEVRDATFGLVVALAAPAGRGGVQM